MKKLRAQDGNFKDKAISLRTRARTRTHSKIELRIQAIRVPLALGQDSTLLRSRIGFPSHLRRSYKQRATFLNMSSPFENVSSPRLLTIFLFSSLYLSLSERYLFYFK